MHSERVLQQLFLRAVILQPQIQKSLLFLFSFPSSSESGVVLGGWGGVTRRRGCVCWVLGFYPVSVWLWPFPFWAVFLEEEKKHNHQKRKKRFNDNSDKRLSNAGRVKTITASPPNFWLSLYLKKTLIRRFKGIILWNTNMTSKCY